MANTFTVTGASGFVGKALVRSLKDSGAAVTAIVRRPDPELVKLGAKSVLLDVSSGVSELTKAVSGSQAVFHVASKVDQWGPYKSFFETNVVGTRNILEACRSANVPKLIYTSSPSVIANGDDLLGVDESVPYPNKHLAHYPATKAIAEREVLQANGSMLKTLALRPHLIFGPGDHHLVPTILERANAGRLVQVGDGSNVVDFTYIDDCVNAHILAEQALDKNQNAAGKPYFISQAQPVKMWAWIAKVLELNKIRPIKRKVSKEFAMKLAWLFETASKLSPGAKPLFTRFLVSQMTTSHHFDIGQAKRELGYKPAITIDKALEITFTKPNEEIQRARAAG